MVAIAATSYATPSAQVLQSRARLDQARRDADQAESNAKQLRTQADAAEQELQTDQTKVTTLTNQVEQSQSTYSVQVSSKATSALVTQAQNFLAPTVAVAANNFSFPSNPLKSYAGATPLGQLLAQRSGRIVNLTA